MSNPSIGFNGYNLCITVTSCREHLQVLALPCVPGDKREHDYPLFWFNHMSRSSLRFVSLFHPNTGSVTVILPGWSQPVRLSLPWHVLHKHGHECPWLARLTPHFNWYLIFISEIKKRARSSSVPFPAYCFTAKGNPSFLFVTPHLTHSMVCSPVSSKEFLVCSMTVVQSGSSLNTLTLKL